LKKNQIIEGIVSEVKFPNKGIINIEGEKVIVKNTIVGQKISAQITKKRKKKMEARLLEIIERADIERTALCQYDSRCGGCSYQTLPYEEQLKLKKNQVKSLLNTLEDINFEDIDIVPSPLEWEYRNKMEFSFGDEYKGGEIALGMHKKGAHYDIVTVNGCKIVDEDFSKILMCTLEYAKENDIPHYKKTAHEGVLRHLVVRKAAKTGQILINLVTSSQQKLELDQLVKQLCDLDLKGELTGILHTINDGVADIVKSDETRILFGQDYYTEGLLGLEFKISAFSFFQTNSLGAEKLYSKVREFAGDTKDKVMFDLYCGTGTIAQIVAPVAKKVIGIEIVEEAVEAAKQNAELNGLTNCEFIAGDVLKEIENVKGEKPELIILDPPREGIHPKALQKIIDFKAKEIVYVSCKPTSLVKDLEELLNNGYELKQVACVDMFPCTPHVETVVKIVKK